MTTAADIRAAFEQVFGPADWDRPVPYDGGPDFDRDEFVSDAEADYRQRAVDARLTETWGPQC